jgi:hypothetical protein
MTPDELIADEGVRIPVTGTAAMGVRLSGIARRGWAALAAIGTVLSALDDRNLPAALAALEPERGKDEGGRCTRCVTHGE